MAAMLAVAVAAGCYKYMSTVKGNQLRQEQALLEKENEDEDETADRDAEGLIKNPNVEYYEKLIANSEKEIERQETYMKDSVIMKLDPYHLPRGTVSFYLNIADEQAAKEHRQINGLAHIILDSLYNISCLRHSVPPLMYSDPVSLGIQKINRQI